ncbi:MAG: DUF2273 domain-containing protein [Selenomonadaceae bacterium]|nr:DUF2273 domain-containing protein [Selenomonadaceae bacterium]
MSNLLENVKVFFDDCFANYRTRKIGFILGMITGIAILIFGFFNTIFVVMCGLIGLFVGSRFDGKDDLVEKLIRKLDEILPKRIQRW